MTEVALINLSSASRRQVLRGQRLRALREVAAAATAEARAARERGSVLGL